MKHGKIICSMKVVAAVVVPWFSVDILVGDCYAIPNSVEACSLDLIHAIDKLIFSGALS